MNRIPNRCKTTAEQGLRSEARNRFKREALLATQERDRYESCTIRIRLLEIDELSILWTVK